MLHETDSKDTPIRLLKIVTNFSSGGTEGQVHNIARFIDRKSFDLGFACLSPLGHYLKEMEHWKIPVSAYPIRSFYNPMTAWQQLRLARHFRRERVQIAHSYNFYANLFSIPAARLAGVPLVIASIRDRGAYLTPMQKLMQKKVCMLADKILVNADSIKDWLIEQSYPEQKIVVIKNGIDLTLYAEQSGSGDVRGEFGIPQDAMLVMMLSRLDPQKGLVDLIEAAALVVSRQPNVYFMIVGGKLINEGGKLVPDAEYPAQLMQKAASLGIADRIILTGLRSDTSNLLKQATLAVLPSHSEGLSNALLESMAAGLPLVATDVGGNPELVYEEVNGLLVPPHNPVALADALLKIIENPDLAKTFSKASLIISRDNYSMTRMLEDTESFYHTELAKRQLLSLEGRRI